MQKWHFQTLLLWKKRGTFMLGNIKKERGWQYVFNHFGIAIATNLTISYF